MRRYSRFGLPTFNIFNLDIIELSFLYDLCHGKISDQQLRDMEELFKEQENQHNNEEK